MAQTNQRLPPASNPERAARPREYFAMLREKGAVVDELGEKLVVDGKMVEQILMDTGRFTSTGNISYGRSRPIIPQQVDPPLHMKYRRILMPLLSPKRVAEFEPGLTAHTNALIDVFIDRGSCELREELAVPVPCDAFLNLLGLPLSDRKFLLDFKDAVMRPGASPGTAEQQQARQLDFAAQGDAYFAGIIRERRKSPGRDFISEMLMAEVNGERISDEEALDICFQLPLAGLDTVTSSILVSWAFLAERPHYQAILASRPELAETAVDELLRVETPTHGLKRQVVADTEIGGCPFKAGERVLLSIGAANIDGSRVQNPNDVNFERRPNRHIAFGTGPHTCLGNNLARIELQVVLREWHRRIPSYRIRPGAELVYSDDNMIRTIDALPLEWTQR